MSKELREAGSSLKDDWNITIKPAGKGGGVVIFDTIDYDKRVRKLLSVEEHYIKVPMRKLDTLKTEVAILLETAKRIVEFVRKNSDFLETTLLY